MSKAVSESLHAEVSRVRQDCDFTVPARRLLERDRELLDRLAQRPDAEPC